ncbi:hypothetical protein IHE33_05045 [Mycetohabitans endofungorum]|uniref:hypothetical protein n=1 Tax=Mycetohabitans endofungorum TaxID=417203 RepID=UPI0030D15E7E
MVRHVTDVVTEGHTGDPRKLIAERLVQGAVTVGYGADWQTVAELFNDAFEQNLVAARVVVESYCEIVGYIGHGDIWACHGSGVGHARKIGVPLSDGFHLLVRLARAQEV